MTMTYSSDDTQQILQLAMTRQQTTAFSSAQLLEMAKELGISPEDLAAATTEWLTQRDLMQQRQQVNSRRRRGFMAHVIPFIAVNTFLIGLNLMTTPKHFWAIYPLSGWGLGLALHGLGVYRANEGLGESAFSPKSLAKSGKCMGLTF
jgi:2TM domain